MPSSLTNLVLHIVFSTKNRTKLITADLKPKLYSYIGGIIRGERGDLLTIGGMPDHMHLLARLPSTLSTADFLRRIKGNSSKWVGDQTWYLEPFTWQRGYAAFSVSQSLVGKVREYIENQENHHKNTPFQDELVSLLKRHGVEYDEEYIWT